MDWVVAVPIVLVALTILVGPGLAILWPWRLGALPAVAIAGIIGVFAVGAAGLLSGLAGLPWAPWHLLLPWAIGGVLSWLAARWRARGATDLRQPLPWRFLVPWAAAGLLASGAAFWVVPHPDRLSQTYDNVFHMSAIAAILDGRDPSSLTLRTLIETANATGFYPAGWHTLAATVVQLTGESPAVAVNSLWIAVAVGVWIPGVVWLTQILVPDHPRRIVIGVAIPLSVAFAAMPYGLLSWGTLYPTFLATALLPAAVALPLAVVRRCISTQGSDRRTAIALGILGTSVAIGAIVFAQPRVLASWVVVLAPAALAASWALARDGWRRGKAARRRVIWGATAVLASIFVGAAVAFVYAVQGLGLFERPLEDRLGGPQAASTQSMLAGLWQVVAQSWPTGVGGTITFAAIPLAAAVIIGIVYAARYREMRWVLVSYVLLAVLYALAAGSDDVLSKLATAVWYKDRYRLSSVVVILAVVLATRGILSVMRSVVSRNTTTHTSSPAVFTVAWLVSVSSVIIIGLTGVAASVGTVFRLPAHHAENAVVSAEQIEFFRGLERYVPESQLVLGDPWDGSAWTQLFGDREPVFPHVNGQWDQDRLILAQRLQDIGSEPAVCDALRRLNVRFVVYSAHELGGGDPAGNLFPGPHLAVDAGLFPLVASAGETSLYRIDQCGEY